jgi:hypothetical protein
VLAAPLQAGLQRFAKPWWRRQALNVFRDDASLGVREFPEGLPPGLYDIWVEWRAPCEAWTSIGLCQAPEKVLTLFASSVRMMFASEEFTDSEVSWLHGVPWGARPVDIRPTASDSLTYRG